uniref:Major facilitator superfamily (MFS) profile domain-containing protein n=1 Tax=Aegilops tauschii subsp. strangulata TaxID=200361 RepID=A0A453ADC2_AEGTS
QYQQTRQRLQLFHHFIGAVQMPWRQPTQALMARKQLKVLHALDIATTQVYHFTAIAIAGMGFFTDAYDLFSISLVTDLLGDKVGRRHIYGVTLKLMVICSIASGLSFHRSRKSVITTLCFFRFWLGFGIGGDYPLSATIMAEYANKKTRGA